MDFNLVHGRGKTFAASPDYADIIRERPVMGIFQVGQRCDSCFNEEPFFIKLSAKAEQKSDELFLS